ncbi:MAG: 2Fe-2S iron-sulfur cluster-binding protein [Candidatus Nanopelagicales bacterium]
MVADARAVWATATVESVGTAAADVALVRLRSDHYGISAPAGSHLDVRIPLAHGDAVRSYSVVRSSSGRVDVAVRLAPASRGGSRAMHALSAGDTLVTTQPLQGFALGAAASSYVLVAGGIGVTAILPMARELVASGREVALLYAGTDRTRMPFLDELAELLGPRLDVRASSEGRRIDPAEPARLAAASTAPLRAEAYVCGPVPLLDGIRRAWSIAALPSTNLRFETFAGGSGAGGSFSVRVPALGIDAVVGPEETLLDALVREGAPVLYDCRRGECGLCVMSVDDVVGRVDHQDVFLSDAERAEGRTICTCVSRISAPEGSPASASLALR